MSILAGTSFTNAFWSSAPLCKMELSGENVLQLVRSTLAQGFQPRDYNFADWRRGKAIQKLACSYSSLTACSPATEEGNLEWLISDKDVPIQCKAEFPPLEEVAICLRVLAICIQMNYGLHEGEEGIENSADSHPKFCPACRIGSDSPCQGILPLP